MPKRRRIRFIFALALFAFAPSLVPAADSFDTEIRPLVGQYCVKCHGEKKPKGGINLVHFTNTVSIFKEPKVWQQVLQKVKEKEMPPEGKPQPSAEERARLLTWVGQTLQNLDEGKFPPNPGRVTIHRLSRTEYNCTMRDLLGVSSRPADKFPTEGGGGGGFDNNADTLFIPPILMERYLEAARDVVNQASPEKIFFTKKSAFTFEHSLARKNIAHFATRAFRRPVDADELSRLLTVYERERAEGRSYEDAVKTVVIGILVSPNFLFRAEQRQNRSEPYLITDYELASRLSYFLWSSMPDEELFQVAGEKRLHEPQVLARQVHRMLRDQKSQIFVENFALQWLRVRELSNAAQPDAGKFPTFTPALRDAMRMEVVQFFDSVLREDKSVLDFLAADYTFLNADLAKHYGITGVEGSEPRKVKLPDDHRGGVLSMAAVLTLTSYPLRTSPVLRGKWILEEILGSPPPPPPPQVKSLPQDDSPVDGLSLRKRLEQHRKDPECASCHQRMDPLGFGLENYDAIGRWREKIADQPIDASGVLPGGDAFEGPGQLKQVLLKRKDEFARNLVEKMLAYALGRGLEYYDVPAVKKIVQALAQNNYRSSVLLSEIVRSFPFQYRQNEANNETAAN